MKLVDSILVLRSTSLKTAIALIDRNRWGIVLIVNRNQQLLGVLTDGDIRRALVNGASVDDKVGKYMNSQPLKITAKQLKTKSFKQLLKQIRKIEHRINEKLLSATVPVVSSSGKVESLVFCEIRDGQITQLDQADVNTNGYHKKVLIVGGAGYLGSVLSELLLAEGYWVRVLDILMFGFKPLSECLKNPRFELIEGDIRDIKNINIALDGVDAVIHLAAIVGDPASQKFPQETIAANYLATMALAMACKYYQINKFIYASTCSVYGVGESLLDEEAELHPVSLYARTKISSEKGILNLSNSNFRPIVLRMSTLHGLSPRMRFDLVVNTFARMAVVEKQITIFGGEQYRPLLHVYDAAQAYLLALRKPSSYLNHQVFNVGSNNQNYTIAQLGQLVKQVLPETKNVLKSGQANAPTDHRTYRVNFNRIKKELKFKPLHSVETSLQEICQAITSGKFKNTKAKKYYNA